MGPIPDFNWPAAEAVRSTDAKIAGHLLHMPTHLDFQVGEYKKAMDWNVLGYKADLEIVANAPERLSFYAGYVAHNMEFCVWAAMYAGCKTVAFEAVDRLDNFLSDEALRKT